MVMFGKNTSGQVPWYKENPFWGGIGGFLSFSTSGLGFGLNGYPTLGIWLLWAALPWGMLAAWCALKGLSLNKRYRTLGFILANAFLVTSIGLSARLMARNGVSSYKGFMQLGSVWFPNKNLPVAGERLRLNVWIKNGGGAPI